MIVEQTPDIEQLAAALAVAQGKYPVITKGKTARVKTRSGDTYTYAYADISDVLKAILPVLSAEGLSVIQVQGIAESGADELVTRLMHSSGQWVQSTVRLEVARFADDGAPVVVPAQDMGSAMTYARRYALAALVGVAIEEDDDGSRATDAAGARSGGRSGGGPPRPMSDAQMRKIRFDIKDRGFDPDKEATLAGRVLGREISTLGELTSAEASAVIEWLAANTPEPKPTDEIPF